MMKMLDDDEDKIYEDKNDDDNVDDVVNGDDDVVNGDDDVINGYEVTLLIFNSYTLNIYIIFDKVL